MKQIDRFLIGALVAGVWTLVALQVNSNSQAHAQQTSVVEQAEENRDTQIETAVIHAS